MISVAVFPGKFQLIIPFDLVTVEINNFFLTVYNGTEQTSLKRKNPVCSNGSGGLFCKTEFIIEKDCIFSHL